MKPSDGISRRRLLQLMMATSGSLLLNSCRSTPPTPTPTAFVFVAPTTAPSTIPSLTPTVDQLGVAPTAGAQNTLQPPPTVSPLPVSTPYPVNTPIQTVAPYPLGSPTPTATPFTVSTPVQAVDGARIFMPTIIDGNLQPRPTVVANFVPTVPVPTQVPTATPMPTITPIPSPTITPSPTPQPCLTPVAPPAESVAPFIGLHASADPSISNAERCTFLDLRPSLIKVLTFHPPQDINLLAGSQPQARWIVRTFLSFGGRNISADNFLEFTLSDTRRTLNVLAGKSVVVELHNEPNLFDEGLGSTWVDGTQFTAWWLDVLQQYRTALPNTQFIYPGLSPGGQVDGIRQDHREFLEQSRAAVEAADGLGVHVYWSAISPMADALATLDDFIGRFPNKPIYITEASYNKDGISDEQRAQEYLNFINALKSRPTVQGVTFFVASASDPTFSAETWVGRSIAKTIGQR